MSNLVKKIQNTTFQHALFKEGAKIILTVSGGPDSVAMLDIFSKLKPKYNLELIIAHVNYNLRGKDSEKDEALVKSLAEKYNLPLEIHRPKTTFKSNLENNLRNVRYDFFEKIRSQNNFDYIATAHNADDQVETYLMRVIRGAGLLGLSSIKFKSGLIIRPLLNISRTEIIKYIKDHKLKYRIDKTNFESVFFRNKIRNKLIPYLAKNFNPGIKSAILSSINSINDDHAFLEELTQKQLVNFNKDFKASIFLENPPAIQKRLLLSIIRKKLGNLRNIDASLIEEIIKTLKSTKSKEQIVVFKGLKMTRKGDRVNLEAVK